MRLRSLFFVLLFACVISVSQAESMTYTLTYNGINGYRLANPGSGSISYAYTPGDATATLTAFDFIETVNGHDGTSSTFHYTLPSIDDVSFVKIGIDGTVTSLNLSTKDLPGSNLNYPLTKLNFAINFEDFRSFVEAYLPSSIHYDDVQSIGDLTLTPAPTVATTPEPSSLALLSTGLLGAVGVVRRRFA